jgi:hypothetical protein
MAFAKPIEVEDFVVGQVEVLEGGQLCGRYLAEASHFDQEVVAEVEALDGSKDGERKLFDGDDVVVVCIEEGVLRLRMRSLGQ